MNYSRIATNLNFTDFLIMLSFCVSFGTKSGNKCRMMRKPGKNDVERFFADSRLTEVNQIKMVLLMWDGCTGCQPEMKMKMVQLLQPNMCDINRITHNTCICINFVKIETTCMVSQPIRALDQFDKQINNNAISLYEPCTVLILILDLAFNL